MINYYIIRVSDEVEVVLLDLPVRNKRGDFNCDGCSPSGSSKIYMKNENQIMV